MGDQTDPTERYDQPEHTDEQRPPSRADPDHAGPAVALARLHRTMVMICHCLPDRW
ncbi:MAG TPA: hypothetical protein VI094_19925 [Propionibacteriaceae bacterium]